MSSRYPGTLFYAGPRSRKWIALTFDDGPDTRFTPQILDVLRRYGVRATFFVIGIRAKQNPGIIRKIVADGHAVGNHTWDHPDLARLPSGQIRAELAQTDAQLETILGYYPAIFRPPYGTATPRVIKEVAGLGYKIVDWSVDTRDWAGTPTPAIVQQVQKAIYPGGIILEHCAGGDREDLSNTVRALPQIIASLKAQGYTFVTVPQLLDIPDAMVRE